MTDSAARTSTGSSINSDDLLTEVRYPLPDGDSPSTSPTDRRLYEYNALGQIEKFTDPNGTVHEYTYDVLGRLTLDDVTTLGSGVDGHVLRHRASYASGGQLYSLTTENNAGLVTSVDWTYNGLGDQATQTTRGFLTGGSGAVTYAWSFNPSGTANHSRLTSITYPGGKVISYDYGAAGSVNDRISRVNALKEGTTTLEAYSYLGLSTIVERDRPQPGVKLTYIAQGSGDVPSDSGAADPYVGLDRFGRVVDQRWRKGTSDLDRFLYGYDKSSNRTWKEVRAAGAPADLDEVYGYDSLDRLTDAARGEVTAGSISNINWFQAWTLDTVGNWAGFDDNGASQTRTHNRRNRITGISGQSTPTYDNNGNMLTDETGKTFRYDAWDRLVVEGSGIENVRYNYDPRGYRVERIASGVSTYYHYTNDWRLLEERLVDSVTVATYVWGEGYVDSLVLRDHTTHGRHYAQQDANFNVTSLTDSSGTVQERYVYDPYGKATYRTGSWGTRAASLYDWQHLHQGGRLDPTTGLYHFRHRDYSPTLGRWVSTDPIGYGDGMNLYQAYASGPVTYGDAYGLEVVAPPAPAPAPAPPSAPAPGPGGPMVHPGRFFGPLLGIGSLVCLVAQEYAQHLDRQTDNNYNRAMGRMKLPQNYINPQPDWEGYEPPPVMMPIPREWCQPLSSPKRKDPPPDAVRTVKCRWKRESTGSVIEIETTCYTIHSYHECCGKTKPGPGWVLVD